MWCWTRVFTSLQLQACSQHRLRNTCFWDPLCSCLFLFLSAQHLSRLIWELPVCEVNWLHLNSCWTWFTDWEWWQLNPFYLQLPEKVRLSPGHPSVCSGGRAACPFWGGRAVPRGSSRRADVTLEWGTGWLAMLRGCVVLLSGSAVLCQGLSTPPISLHGEIAYQIGSLGDWHCSALSFFLLLWQIQQLYLSYKKRGGHDWCPWASINCTKNHMWAWFHCCSILTGSPDWWQSVWAVVENHHSVDQEETMSCLAPVHSLRLQESSYCMSHHTQPFLQLLTGGWLIRLCDSTHYC